MKTSRLLTLLTTAFTLGACSSGMNVGFGLGNSGGGVSFGSGISIPIGGFGTVRNNPARSGINIVDTQVVSYFGSANQAYRASTTPITGGFYRRLLGKQGNLWLVQDHYYNSNKKYNDPMLLSVDAAYRFESLPNSGTFYTYHENGQVASKRVYDNQRLLSSQRWNTAGQALP